MPPPPVDRLSTIDLVEAFQLGHAVSTLHDLGILASLKHPSTAEKLASKHKLDTVLLCGVLEYVVARTDLVEKQRNRFIATTNYSRPSRFLLDLYAGAYCRNATQLTKLIRAPSLAPSAVDRARHARAFAEVQGLGFEWVAQVIQELQFNYVLDIGCGPAALLVELAVRNPKLVGWGLDVNPATCKAARARIRAAGVEGRVKVIEGHSSRLCEVLPDSARSTIQTVTACQVANEMFGSNSARAVTWLRGIRKMLPGRPLLLADYYGRLGSKVKRIQRETLLHDYAQLISGQGVPPADMRGWRAVYNKAGCRIVHVIEDTSSTRFIHIVML